MVEIIWNNGQGEFDCDFLLNLTDEILVSRIYDILRISGDFIKSIKVNGDDCFVNIIIVELFGVSLFKYDKESGDIFYDAVTQTDLRWILSFYNAD